MDSLLPVEVVNNAWQCLAKIRPLHLTFLDGARWDVASKITVIVNINSGGVLKKTAGWNAAKQTSGKNNGRGELEKNNGSELKKKKTGGNSKQTCQSKN